MLKRYTALRRNTKPLKRTPLARVSKKRRAEYSQYRKLRAFFLSANPLCQVQVVCAMDRAKDVHHRKGRGPYLCAVETFTATCRRCHDHIHSHPTWAREVGWLQK